MAKTESAKDVSPLGDVTQLRFWDHDTKKIEVYHNINIEAGDVYRESIKTLKKGEQGYDDLAKMYKVQKGQTITIFKYIHSLNGPAYPRSLLFPENGGYYPLEDLPHVIIARMEPTGDASTTQGVAL